MNPNLVRVAASLAALAALALTPARAGNFPYIATGGFDYDGNAIQNNQSEATWLATHHDVVIGPIAGGSGFQGVTELTYDRLKTGNPAVQVYWYVPYQTILPWESSWMENWCRTNATACGTTDVEDLYCHYRVDTTVLDRDGVQRTVPGWGAGSATSRAASRMMSTWWKGAYPNVCPMSAPFRAAYNALLAQGATINASLGKYLDGTLLDTFEGTVDTYYKLQVERLQEMYAWNGNVAPDATKARNHMTDEMAAHYQAMAPAVQKVTGKPFTPLANGADVSNYYQWYPDLYANRFSPTYNAFSIEYMITAGFNTTERLSYMKKAYDDMTHPTRPIKYFVNSQTNNTTGVTLAFTQFILASHYLINNPNGVFSYHRGSAGFYGTENGSYRTTHWHTNIEYDVGTPVARSGNDYWGTPNTDRFFVFADGGSTYKVMAREYTNVLVLAKFGNVGGWANIGTNRASVALGGTYHLLQADNTLGPAITTIDLGFSEGAILVKDAASGGGGNGGGGNLPPTTPGGNRRSDSR